MFIGITGPKCSGKHTIAEYLVKQHNFQILTLTEINDILDRDSLYINAIKFNSVSDMQNYVTERWQKNFVTCDIDCRELWTLK